MNRTLQSFKRLCLGFCLLMLGPAWAAAQEAFTVTGRVTDETGEPLIGAAVLVEGTTEGDITDAEGNFSLQVREGDKLEISYMSYLTQTVPVVRTRTVYNIRLEPDALNTSEIVVTALGIRRDQKALGYAVTEVDGDEVASANTVSPVAALQGKAAGVSINGSDGGVFGGSKIQIRGVSTLEGNNQPIFVVDGVILDNDSFSSGEFSNYSTDDYGNQLKNLNPDDFENVSILKGSAATALYGSRGINGAVVITTKSGSGKKGFGISVSQTTGIDWVYATPKFQNEYGSGTIAGNINYGQIDPASGSYYRFDVNQFYLEENSAGALVPSLRGGSGLSWGPRFDNRRIIGYNGQETVYKAYKRNMKQAYQVGVNTNTNVSIQGGSDKINFYFSDSYNYRKGTFTGNNFERNSMLLKGKYNVSETITLDASVNFVQSDSQNPPYLLGNYFWNGTYGRDYDVKFYKDKWHTAHGGVPSTDFGDAYGTVPGMDFWFDLHNKKHVQKETMVIPILKLNIRPLDWLSVNGELNMNYYTTRTDWRDLGQGYRNQGGQYKLGLSEKIQRTAKASVNLNKRFGDFDTGLIVGGEWYGVRNTTVSQWTEGGLVVPGQFFIGNSINVPGYESMIDNTKNIYSVYFLASFSWKERLFLDVTGRNDWSTALLYSTGQGDDSYFYPSVSASWLVSETFRMPKWISYAKIRTSWAQVGNDTDPYRINRGYGLSQIQLSNGIAYLNTFTRQIIDPDLRPERKNSFEAGFDLRLLRSRIGIDFTWYKENTRDQIIEIPAPVESGVNSQLVNAGNIQNQGIELAVNTVPIDHDHFTWKLNFIYTRNRNKIISLHPDVGAYKLLAGNPSYGNMRIGSVAYVGGEYGVLLSDAAPQKFQAYDTQGNPVDDPRNGMNVLAWNEGYMGAYPLRSNVIQQVGTMAPKFEGSISNSFSIGNFDINVLIDMRFGGYMASMSSKYGTAYGLLDRSLGARDAAHGGITWTSKYAEANYGTFHDGIIPDGVFQEGTTVKTPGGSSVDVSGMTYRDAYELGYVEPTHVSCWQYRTGAFNTGVVNNNWVNKVKYIALRQVSVGYQFPEAIARKLHLSNLYLSFDARNLCYLFNSLPNRIHPESFNGNSAAGSFFEMNMTPYTATYALSVRFSL